MLKGSSLYSQKIKDTIFFLNGSKMVGEIKGIKLGVLTFDPDDANDITVELQKLKTIIAISKLFRIETIAHRVYFGNMIANNKAGYVFIASGLDTIEYRIEEISVVYSFKHAFRNRFSGYVNAGFSFTKSSNLGRFNIDARLSYMAKKDEITLSTTDIYTITDTGFSRDKEDITTKYNHYFSTAWFGTLLFKYQRNLELGLLRRYQEGIGAGNKFITSKHIYAWARTGVVFNQEKYDEGEYPGTLPEVFLQAEFNFFRFTKPKISLLLNEALYYGVTNGNRLRNDGQLDLSWELVKDLDLVFSIYNNYDSKPPTAENSKFDFGVVFSVGFTF